jgi:hypothetical protein
MLLIVLLIVLLVVSVPQTGWHAYGYAPTSVLGVVLMVILVLLLMGRL